MQDQEAKAFFAPIPAALPDIGLVMPLDEALSWLAVGRPSADLQVWENRAGELSFRDHNGVELRKQPDGSHPQFVDAFLQASRAMHSALRDGSLLSYVAPDNGQPLQVPRFYWNGVNPESLHHTYRGMSSDDHGAGCAVLFSRAAFDKWRATVPPFKLPVQPKPSHGDVVTWCTQWIEAGKGNGMDKAWLDFQALPEHQGLSRDDVFRPAWRDAKTR